MTVRLRPELADLPTYTPGRNVPGAIKLASNETVHGPLPSVRSAIDNASALINRYPDNGYAELRSQLAKHLDVTPENIAAGCGSVSLCQQLIQITASVGDEVLFGWRSFETYPLAVRIAGATSVEVPLADHTYDLTAMAAAVTDATRLIFVCNPNNPTGTVVAPAALRHFVESVPEHILVVIDEAYIEYVREDLSDSLALIRDHPNVVALRTFSKAYGLAGLRVGYAIGDPEIISALGKVYVPFSTSSVAQAAAVASLAAASELLERTNNVVNERARVRDRLLGAGYTVPVSQANFLWLPLEDRSMHFAQAAADARIIVRPFGNDGVRVTIGAPEENDAFLGLAEGWRSSTGEASAREEPQLT